MSRFQTLREILSDVDLLVSTSLVAALVMGGFAVAMLLGAK